MQIPRVHVNRRAIHQGVPKEQEKYSHGVGIGHIILSLTSFLHRNSAQVRQESEAYSDVPKGVNKVVWTHNRSSDLNLRFLIALFAATLDMLQVVVATAAMDTATGSKTLSQIEKRMHGAQRERDQVQDRHSP
jgi:hypothetical protein